MLNLHEEERSKPSSWIPVGWIPHYDRDLAPKRKEGFDSHAVRQNEIFHACFRALLSEFSDCEPEAEVLPWETEITVSQCSDSVVSLAISRKQTVRQVRLPCATGE